MAIRIPHLSLANANDRLRITQEGEDPDEVTVVKVLDRAVRVRYRDQSTGVLYDKDYDDDLIEVLPREY